jgi:biopolymer transport protein ExbD
MRKRKPRKQQDKASTDLTPMIDITFQLLIFFILCTRFYVPEKNHRIELPKDSGTFFVGVPKESLTVYCRWDAETSAGHYVLAQDARGRMLVDDSHAGLTDLVIFPNDPFPVVEHKRARYKHVFDAVWQGMETYIERTGSTDQIEIAFAHDPARGAASGTAPWMFVSLAIDAAAQVNENRRQQGLDALPVVFKFADALGRFAD